MTRKSFQRRKRGHNFLRYNTNVSDLDDSVIPVQFSLESLRIYIHSKMYAEVSDIDAFLWGQRVAYAVEVKEKTEVSDDKTLGPWFGLDVGPFTKLAYFAAWNGSVKSLFVVREIDDEKRRKPVGWWAILFTDIAKYASWVFRGGGRNMLGGSSAVVRIPKSYFRPLEDFLDSC